MKEVAQIRAASWAALIKERQESGLTVKQWCADHQVSENAYYYWLKRLRKAALSIAELPREKETVTQFVKVPTAVAMDNRDVALEIQRGDMRIEVHNHASAQILSFLREVILSC